MAYEEIKKLLKIKQFINPTKPLSYQELDFEYQKGNKSYRFRPIGYIEKQFNQKLLNIPLKLVGKVIFEINKCPFCNSATTYHHVQQQRKNQNNVWKFSHPIEYDLHVGSIKYDFCQDCHKEFEIEIYVFERI